MNLSPLVLCAVSLLQADLPKPVEITEQRADFLSTSLKELQFLTERLEALGDPSQRRPEEVDDPDAYYDRVRQIYENRARVLVVLHWEYEDALEARYTLEADLKEYAQKMEAAQKENTQRVTNLEKRRSGLVETELRARNEGIVVASLVLARLVDQEQKLAARRDLTATEQANLQRIRVQIEDYRWAEQEAPKIANRNEMEQKHANKTLEQLQSEVLRLRNVKVDSDFEMRFLDTRVLSETPGLLDEYFGRGCAEAIASANDLLKQSRELEDRAAWVAIAAGYLHEDLKLIGRARNFFEQRQALRAILDQEEIRKRALQKITGERVELSPQDLQHVFVRPRPPAGP